VLIERFSLAVTAEALRANIGSKSAISLYRGAGWPKISGRKSRPHQLFFFIWYKNLDRYFFCFVTIHAFDRQTDGQTDRQNCNR